MGKLGNIEHSIEIEGKTLSFQGGRLAQQAGGSVVATLGDTTVLTTTTASSNTKEHLGFFPLTVDVEERMYAAGKIPGGFFKREGRPGENAVLSARLIDRPLRPTFREGIRNEVQIVNTILQTGQVDPYDVVAINSSSVATMLSGIPFDGPVAGLRYAMLADGSWTAFPTFDQLEDDVVFQMVIAARMDGDDVAILMVEADATEQAVKLIQAGAPEPTEERIAEALEDVQPILRDLCEAQIAFVEQHGAPTDRADEFPHFADYDDTVYDHVADFAEERLRAAYTEEGTKQETTDRIFSLRDEAIADFVENGPEDLSESDRERQAKQAFKSLEKTVVRKIMTETGKRVDGRGPRDIRSLTAQVGVLDRVHGSSIFERGETQVVNVLALGPLREAQRLDSLHPEEEKRYMHHYNMPPYSTGEARRIGSPKRREIGHGLLAERALLPVIPDDEEWPYAMRLVSEAVSSNGSTSMASVCGSTLSLMDGGVPIFEPVAGIAMGLISEEGTFTTLTDIQGVEDFFGDMDFKVAGTRAFITALQLDTKLSGIPSDVLTGALDQARDARLEILDVMADAISEPRDEVHETAPRVLHIELPMDKIGDVIGPKGKIIREITEETGADVDIDDDGTKGWARVYASERDAAQAAADRINAIANPVLPKEGERYHGTIVKTVDFGAFVSLTPGIDGLLHISKIGNKAGRRLDHAEEFVDVGDKVWVEVKEVRSGGKYSLDYVDEDEVESRSGGNGSQQARSEEDASDEPSSRDEPAERDDAESEAPNRKRTRTRSRG